MTTVTCKDGVMAADTQLTDFSFVMRVQKIRELPDGSIVGGAGTWYVVNRAMEWLAKGGKGKPPKVSDSILMILKPDRSIWLVEERFPAYRLLQEYAAIGCGAQPAMLAMNDGADAVTAIKKVIKVDCMTSDPVQYLTLKPKKGKARTA